MANRRLVFVSAALMLAGCATTPLAATPTPSRAALRQPDFELSSARGASFRLSEHRGRGVVLLAFWDTWCEPCKTQLPPLDRLYRAHKDKGLAVFAISMDDPSTVG